MPRPLVIVHGYSDTSESFQPLADALAERLGLDVHIVSLADYVTLNDYVSFADLLAAMDAAWDARGLARAPWSVDMVVHSTGALVARQWLAGFAPDRAPVKRLVMLAPANFGSPLAHKGQSFIGRVIKGFQSNADGPLQSGRLILQGLELGSPFTWNLAMADRFATPNLFDTGRCLCTVLVGNKGYSGISAMANEPGGDGTVRVSTANMECARLTLDFERNPQDPVATLEPSTGRTAFGFLQGYNHSTIKLEGTAPSLREPLLDLIGRALTVSDSRFPAWIKELGAITEETSTKQDGYQNLVVVARTQENAKVADYVVEFYEDDKNGGALARFFHTAALESVHVYGEDSSSRSLYVNCTKLASRIDRTGETLNISVTAHPWLNQTRGRVGFRTFDDNDIGGVKIPAERIAGYFSPHRTVLATLRLKWERGPLLRYRGKDEPYTPI